MTRSIRWASTIVVTAVVMLGSAPSAATVTLSQAQPGLEAALVARAIQPGEVVRVDVICVCGGIGPLASAFGLDVPLALSQDGTRWQGLFGIDIDVVPGVYPLVVAAPHLQPALAREDAAARPAETVPHPDAAGCPRVRRSAGGSRRSHPERGFTNHGIFNTITPRVWDRPFALPVTTPPTRNFGSRSVFNGKPRSPHAGIDFSSPTGTVVTAPAAGTVVLAADLFFTGNTVILDHGAGLFSLFAHLSSMTVGAGDVVGRGARLGRVGATGRATGPHLHWGVRLKGTRVDPLSLMVATEDRRALTLSAPQRGASRNLPADSRF